MNTTMQQARGASFKQELATLAFISRGGNWLFLLMSRLAEPLMFLSVLYVIAETVLPDVFKAHTLVTISGACIIVLNLAPEVIMPGCFIQSRLVERRQAWMYKAMCVVFLLLAFVTLAAFIWKYPHDAVSVILFFRCAAGVLYSLLVRISSHSETPAQITPTIQPVVPQFHQVKIAPIVPGKHLQSFSRLPFHLVSVSDETPAVSLETPQTEIATSSDETSLEAAIATLLAMNSSLSSRELASALNRPHSTVYRCMKHLAQLKKQSA